MSKEGNFREIPWGDDKILVLFESAKKEGTHRIILDPDDYTLWATELQIADIFDRDRTTINKHISNIFKEDELDESSTCANFALVRKEGEREIKREVLHYNLDVLISVGYRVKSPIATEFRKWATAQLKSHLIKGYSINKKLIESKNERIIEQLTREVQSLRTNLYQSNTILTEGFLSIISHYSRSFNLLERYDKNDLALEDSNEDVIYLISYKDVKEAIESLRQNLINKGEASEFFGREKDDSFRGILGSISQTVFGELAYKTVEEQAAQLLYSTIKGHAFNDGNKRIGSFLFVWFLEKNNYHLDSFGNRKISENTLTVLALMIAQSKIEQRDTMLNLVANLLLLT